MRLFYRLLILPIFIVLTINTNAQENCKVLLPAIANKYEGDCNKGKANGLGKASGEDNYDGSFKDGLPDGKGIYTWKNGNIYEGEFNKGKMNGKGSYTYKRSGKTDSLVYGFWDRNTYIGQFSKPYEILNKTTHFSKIDVRHLGDKLNIINISVSSTSGGAATFNADRSANLHLAKPEINEIITLMGNYLQKTDQSFTSRGTMVTLSGVSYPFRAKYRVGYEEIELQISQPGAWNIDLFLSE